MILLLLQFGATKLLLSTILAGLAWGVQQRLRQPRISHLLWMLVLVTMTSPTPVTIPLLDTMAAAKLPAASLAYPFGTTGSGDPSRPHLLPLIVVAIWVLGSAVVLGMSLVRVIRFHRMLTRTTQAAPPEQQQMAAGVAESLGLARVPAICLTDANLSPLVWWIGAEVRVVMPRRLLTGLGGEQIAWIMAHELAHVSRRDHWVRWLEWIACIVFWWNPVSWLARRSLHSAEELCCDMAVIAALQLDPRRYARTLLDIVESMGQAAADRGPTLATNAVGGGRTAPLRERLTSIIAGAPVPAPSRLTRAVIRWSPALLLPLGLVSITTSRAQSPGTTTSAATLSCATILATLGSLAPGSRVTDGLVASCREHGTEYAGAGADPRVLYNLAARHIREEVAAGILRPEAGQGELATFLTALKQATAARPRATATTAELRAKCAAAGPSIRESLAAGTLTTEGARHKLATDCPRIEG